MRQQWRSHKGQSILSEYTMVIFLVIAALVAITVYVQRSIEARIHDARNFMIDSVANTSVCDANCLLATGTISHEYEPYYTQTAANIQQGQSQELTAATGNAQVIGAIYGQFVNEDTQSNSVSNQLPAVADQGGN
jgi:hypothetical protein